MTAYPNTPATAPRKKYSSWTHDQKLPQNIFGALVKSKKKQELSQHQRRVLTKLRQAKQEGVRLFLTGADKKTADSLVRRGLAKHIIQYGIESPIHFEAI